jgi:uncharacterized BrkB/YihY/UPF0761 family membrane protein
LYVAWLYVAWLYVAWLYVAWLYVACCMLYAAVPQNRRLACKVIFCAFVGTKHSTAQILCSPLR